MLTVQPSIHLKEESEERITALFCQTEHASYGKLSLCRESAAVGLFFQKRSALIKVLINKTIPPLIFQEETITVTVYGYADFIHIKGIYLLFLKMLVYQHQIEHSGLFDLYLHGK